MEWKKGVISGIIAGIVMLVIGSAFMVIPFTTGVTQWYSVTFPEMSSPMAMSILMAGIVLTLTSNRFREHKQSKCFIQVHHFLWNLRDNAAPTYFKMVDLAVFV